MRDSVLYVGSNMSEYTRRDLLKLGVAAPAAARALLRGAGGDENPTTHESSTLMQAEKNVKPSPRERISLDFGWRFHLGNADDASKDFQFGESSILGKSGEFFEACRKDFDDSSWREIDLPHDWAVELPFESGEGHSKDVQTTLVDHGCKPLGRDFRRRVLVGTGACLKFRQAIWAAEFRLSLMEFIAMRLLRSTGITSGEI